MQAEGSSGLWKDIRSQAVGVLPWLLFAGVLCTVWQLVPSDFFTRRYASNLFIQPSTKLPGFYLLAVFTIMNLYARVLFLLSGLLCVGIAGVAALVNAAGLAYSDSFYLVYAFGFGLAGVVAGYMSDWRRIRSAIAAVFYATTDITDRAIRAGFIFCVGAFLIWLGATVIFPLLEDGQRHEMLHLSWRGWPYIACLLWGWASACLTGFKEAKSVV